MYEHLVFIFPVHCTRLCFNKSLLGGDIKACLKKQKNKFIKMQLHLSFRRLQPTYQYELRDFKRYIT